MSLTAEQYEDVAWALDQLSRLTLILLEPLAAMDEIGADKLEITVELTTGDRPMTPENAKKLLAWVSDDEMQNDLRAEAARNSGLKAVMPNDKATLEIAMRGFDRIKTSDLTMDGYTTFHGRLSMNEVVAMNRLFEIVAELPDGELLK